MYLYVYMYVPVCIYVCNNPFIHHHKTVPHIMHTYVQVGLCHSFLGLHCQKISARKAAGRVPRGREVVKL